MKKIIIAALAALALATSAPAHADGYLTPGEEDLGDALSTSACSYIDTNGVTTRTMTTMFNAIYPERVIASGGDVADVINYIVANYCPQHWKELVSFGDALRNSR